MKYPMTLLFSFCCFYCGIIAYSNTCMKQDYKPRAGDDLKKQFQNGLSLLNLATSILSSVFIPTNNLWKFCACALYKRSELKSKIEGTSVRPYEFFLQNMEITASGYVPVAFSHRYWFNFKHQVIFATCQYDQDTFTIFKGFQQKSYIEPIYDLYIGTLEPKSENPREKDVTFQGIIEDVNVKYPPIGH